MEWLNTLAQAKEMPFMAAFALGLLTAIAPCPLATNITATAYISKGFQDPKKVFISGLWYTLGRAFAYTLLGLILYFGASKFHLARFFQGNGERWLGPVLLFIGLVMLNVIKLEFLSKLNIGQKLSERFQKQSYLSAFMLGILFALAFCPYSGALYFGMLIPMSLSSEFGIGLPPVFALGTGLPVILFTYLLAFGVHKMSSVFNTVQKIERWMRIAAGITFVITGLYYMSIFFM